jgi:hypothetical protein
MAVVGIIAPVAIVIEIFVAYDVVGQILSRTGTFIAMIATVAPGIKLIGVVVIFNVGVQRIGAAKCSSLSGVDGVGLTVAGRLALSIARTDCGVGAVFACLQAVVTWPIDGKRQIRSIDFVSIILVEAAHTKIERARCKLNLHRMVI